MKLPEQYAKIALEIFNDKIFLFRHRDEFYIEFIKYYSHLLSGKNFEMLNDFISLDEVEFFEKWPIHREGLRR